MSWRFAAVLPLLFLVGCMSPLDVRKPAMSRVNGLGMAATLVGLAQIETPHTQPANPSGAPRYQAASVPASPQIEVATPPRQAPAPLTVQVPPPAPPAPEVSAPEVAQAPVQVRPPVLIPYADEGISKTPDHLLVFVRNVGVQRCNGRSCSIDTSEKQASAVVQAAIESLRPRGFSSSPLPGQSIHVIDIDEYPQAAQQWRVYTAPVVIQTRANREISRVNGTLATADMMVAMIYPHRDSTKDRIRIQPFHKTMRGDVSRTSGDRFWGSWRAQAAAMGMADVPTQIDGKSLLLPKTQISLERQAIEFLNSQESRLNRFLSIAFKEGEISHSGKAVNFSSPPEVRLHMTESGPGLMLDSLKSIEFTAHGANLHLTRLGTIPLTFTGV